MGGVAGAVVVLVGGAWDSPDVVAGDAVVGGVCDEDGDATVIVIVLDVVAPALSETRRATVYEPASE